MQPLKPFFSHFDSAEKIISGYTGNEPFHLYLKKYFSSNKKHGSRDRKTIAALCYNYFRLGHALDQYELPQRILYASLFVDKYGEQDVPSNGNIFIVVDKDDKEETISINVETSVFPFSKLLSAGVDPGLFAASFLRQPDVFIRIRPGFESQVLKKISQSNIPFKMLSSTSVAFKASVKLDEIVNVDKEVQVQDYNSQATGKMLELLKADHFIESVWDCCAASGGKSIMAVDILGKIDLTVSDKRESILENLNRRFTAAGIKNYHSLVANLEKEEATHVEKNIDLVIADLPCTGSGTWARTPEQLYYFKEEKTEEYSRLQKNIISHVITSMKKGAHLLYITCSVFKKENEDVVDFMMNKFRLQLIRMDVLKGYEMKADTMFAALLRV